MKPCKTFLLFSVLILSHCLCAQQPSKISMQLKWHLEATDPQEMVPFLLESNSTDLTELVNRFAGKVRLKVGSLYSIEIPAENVWPFSEETAVEKIEFSNAPAHFLNDTMLIQTKADQVQAMAAPLREKYSGKGVILGVIDSGIELDHPDFKDSLGNTRVLYIWDQGVAYNAAQKPGNYNYGVEWDSTEINNQTSTHDDRASEFGHGSMVTGVAASNGLATGNFKGIAPEVNIIAVATDYSAPNWLQTVAEAVDYIYGKADSLGMPCVINASIGTYLGSHDGEDIAARMIDQMIKARSGRTLVAAAGNAGTFNFHLQHSPIQDTVFTWFEHTPQLFNGQGGLYFQLWSDTADMKDLKFSIGVDRKQGSFYEFRGRTAFDSIQNRLNLIYTDSIVGSNHDRIAYVYTYAEQSQGRYLLEVSIPQPDSAQYLFRLETAGTGKIDLWSALGITGTSNMIDQNLPTVSQFPAIQKYVRPDSLQSMVSSFTCLPSVITVGNYVNRSSWLDVNQQNQYVNVVPGQISVNSSLGPNRRGYLKPDISSAGDYMFSSGRIATMQTLIQTEPAKIAFDSLHMRNGGTSMAAPTVAGMVALYLEQCSGADHQRIKQDLLATARTDQFTLNLPNPKWGAGKADAMGFLSQNIISLPIVYSFLPQYCEGDTALVPLLQAGSNYRYRWNNDDTLIYATLTQTDTVFARVFDGRCWGVSDTASVLFMDAPPKPIIFQRSDSLISLDTGFYQWFLNGNAMIGATDSILKVGNTGYYHLEIGNLNNCFTASDSIYYVSTDLPSTIESSNFKLYPNPTSDLLNIQSKERIEKIVLFDQQGRMVFQNLNPHPEQLFQLSMSQFGKGIYFLQLKSRSTVYLEKIIIW
jgi:subtilisin family serine protease